MGALNGYLPAEFTQVVYMRDRPVPPSDARILATDEAGRPAISKLVKMLMVSQAIPGLSSA